MYKYFLKLLKIFITILIIKKKVLERLEKFSKIITKCIFNSVELAIIITISFKIQEK